MKKILIGLAVFIAIGAVAVRNMARKTEDVREMCRIPLGTPIEEAVAKGRALGFSEERRGALDAGIEARLPSGQPLSWPGDAVPGFDEGSITFSKTSLPPFMRNYCELKFTARKVSGHRTYTLD